MSHFLTLVFGDDISGQLNPYCESLTKRYNTINNWLEKYNDELITVIYDLDGQYHKYMDKKFWPQLTQEDLELIKDKSYIDWEGILNTRTFRFNGEEFYRKLVIPEGYKEKELPVKNILSFQDYLKEYDFKEYQEENEETKENDINQNPYFICKNNKVIEVIEFTNPDAQWDWYEIGGRWSGWLKTKNKEILTIFLKNKDDIIYRSEPTKVAKDHSVAIIRNNDEIEYVKAKDLQKDDIIIFDGNQRQISKIFEADLVDQAFVEDIDLMGMISDNARRVEKEWLQADEIIKDGKHANYDDNVIRSNLIDNRLFRNIEDYQLPRHDFIEKFKYEYITPYAYVENGNWFAQGKMGWWGMSDNKFSDEDWVKQFWNKLLDLEKGTLVTVVDCHI